MRTLAADATISRGSRRSTLNSNVAAKTVSYGDSSDLAGWPTAAGIGLRLLTGSMVWDDIGSVLIGLLLTGRAVELVSPNLRLLRTSADRIGDVQRVFHPAVQSV